jgi:nucleoside-diphosphate-sugar epimerase
MHVLLTGASGFLGGHIAEAFVQHGHHVVGIVRQTSRTDFLQALGVELVVSELEDTARLGSAMRGVDVVIHAAAQVHTHGFWRDFVQTTVEGTRHVLEAAQQTQVHHFIQISTVGVYGFPPSCGGPPFTEANPYCHIHRWNYYSRAKIEAEKLVRDAQQSNLITTTVIRPTWVYGPRDTTTLARFVAALRTRRFKWIGNGDNRLSVVYVTDVTDAVVRAATAPRARGQIYNVATDEISPTQREFVTRICQLMELPLPEASVPYAIAYVLGFGGECVAHLTRYRVCPSLTRLTVLLFGGNRRFSSEKIRAELGWRPIISFEEGIHQATAWHRNRPLTAEVEGGA